MSGTDPDVIVVGSGPNGLVAACWLAGRGYDVLVLEAHPGRAGGAVCSEEATLPGFVHDVGAAFFPFAAASPAFRALDLEAHGLRWRHAGLESCHPAPDGSAASIARAGGGAANFGSPRDTAAWAKLVDWHRSIESRVIGLLLEPVPAIGPLLSLLPADLFRLARHLAASGRALACRLFDGEAARRVLPGLALHVDVGPDDRFGAGLGYVLGLSAAAGGNAVPRGGAGAITDSLIRLLRAHRGRLRLGTRVERVLISEGQARGVRCAGGEEIVARRAVLADTAAPSLFLDLVDPTHMPAGVVRRMRRFRQGWGTFKVDWALSSAVPWSVEEARRSAVVHAGDSVDDLARFTGEVRDGRLPEHPYLVVGQQSLADDSRAPRGSHTLWAYSRVPPEVAGGWSAHRESFADRIEQRIDGLAPGFRASVLARRILTPDDLFAADANLVGGDLGGGSNAWNRQLLFRPLFPWFRYRTPVRRLYLCSSYAHPGAGVHGMCGYNAARIAAADLD